MNNGDNKNRKRYEEIIESQAETIRALSRTIEELSSRSEKAPVPDEQQGFFDSILWSFVEALISSTIAALLIAALSSGNVFAIIAGFLAVMLLSFITLYHDAQVVKEANRRVKEAENRLSSKRKNDDAESDNRIEEILNRLEEQSLDENKEDIRRIRDILNSRASDDQKRSGE